MKNIGGLAVCALVPSQYETGLLDWLICSSCPGLTLPASQLELPWPC